MSTLCKIASSLMVDENTQIALKTLSGGGILSQMAMLRQPWIECVS